MAKKSAAKPSAPDLVIYFAKNLGVVIGLVLIWRGVWYVLDAFDILFLRGSHFLSGILGIALGLLLLYLPDKDLKEIQKL